ncbi:MAG: dihydrolipoyl dehydrogenase [Pseudomonadota bacterium]
MSKIDLTVPDLGNFDEVAVIDVLVKVGDKIELETPLVTLETDKATMDVPSVAAGTVVEVLVQKGGKIGKGGLIARIEGEAAAAKPAAAPAKAPATAAPSAKAAPAPAAAAAPRAAPAPAPKASKPLKPDVPHDRETQLLVLGAGPGGYTAAFRAADLGLKVTLVERWPMLGGVCLNVGCIPSKALLHAAKVIDEVGEMRGHGIDFGAPNIDLAKLLEWKGSVVKKLVGGLSMLARQRKVEVVQGTGKFASPHVMEVTGADGKSQKIRFEQCIIAAGSEAIKLPFIPNDPRVIDSTGALELAGVPKRLLVIGGGIIGLEMATVYAALGAKLSVVELTGQLMPGADPDLVKPLEKRLKARYEQILLNTKVTGCTASAAGLAVEFEDASGKRTDTFDRVLVAVGRSANGKRINLEAADIEVSDRGIISVDKQMRTNLPHVFAVGDLVPGPMLAHKAMHEAKVAAECAAGEKSYFDARVIPSVAYTDPEVAWVGLTETDAKKNGTSYKKGQFPWAASGRSLALGRDEGFTKLLFDPVSHRVLGGGMVGPNAGELVAEVALAIEMGADAADIGLTIHPHPTLSETVGLSAEAFEGTLTDLYIPKRP